MDKILTCGNCIYCAEDLLVGLKIEIDYYEDRFYNFNVEGYFKI